MTDKRLQVLQNPAARRAFAMHDRIWHDYRYVYPVISRRSRGLSIGVNLNPDKVCNFDCIYCCVDRKIPGKYKKVDLPILREELSRMLALAHSAEIFQFDPFNNIPPELRRVNDIAFSGDGEPTSCPNFLDACQLAAELAQNAGLAAGPHPLKLIVITNATLFHRLAVRKTLEFLDQHHGEIWAKLDAGTVDYYKLVDRTKIPFTRVLENVQWCCQTRPTVIQSLFMNVHGQPPTKTEIAAYAAQLSAIAAAGGTIKLVQIYTVARRAAESFATPLSETALDEIASHVRSQLPAVPVEIYP